MRCKQHPIDLSSSAGVCASCLRERLSALIAAQTPSHAQPDLHSPAHPPPQPLVFPRSVSPNPPKQRNKSLLRRFHSTPQARPDSTCVVPPANKQHRKFSLLSHLFRSRSEKFISSDGGSISSQADSVRTSSSSPSWFSFHRGRRRGAPPPTLSSLEESGDASRWKPFWVSDHECQEGSPSGSESSSQGRRRTAASGPAPARRTRHSNNVHGMGLCMNPLVRASPKRCWNQRRGANQETGLSGEIRAPSQPQASKAATSGSNRSRKLTGGPLKLPTG